MIITPPSLTKGDSIGIVCPAGYMPYEKAQTCIDTLRNWGYTVKTGVTLGSQFHYFSGTDEERLNDLQQMLDDPSIKAILCGRGGYGVSRIIDRLDFTQFTKNPKWLIGFSDITVLHAHITRQYNIATLHAPMAGAFNGGDFENEFIQSLHNVLQGNVYQYTCAAHILNRPGNATGELVGGNLSLVAHLVGSKSGFETKNRILFLEDVGEYLYNIDRMFIQLKRSGMLDGLAGIILGGFSEMKDTVIPFGAEVHEVIKEHVNEFSYPVCFGFPVSHERENYALKMGVLHELVVGKEDVLLKEIQ